MTNSPPDAAAGLMTRLLASGYKDVAQAEKAHKQLLEARERAAKALVVLNRRIKQFAEHLRNARLVANWAYGEQEGDHVSFDEACRTVSRDPDTLAEHIFSGLSPDLTRIVMRGKGQTCPLCKSSG